MATNTVLGYSDFNIGQDVSLTLRFSNGQNFSSEDIGIMTDIDMECEDHEVIVKAINYKGLPKFISIPAGVGGKVQWARKNGIFQKLVANKQKMFTESGLILTVTMQVQIRNRDGAIDTILVPGASFSKSKLFDAKADKEIGMGFSFKAESFTIT